MSGHKKLQILTILALSGLLGLLGPTFSRPDVHAYHRERTEAHRALAENDFSGAERHLERALSEAKFLSGAQRAVVLLEKSKLDAQFGNSDQAVKLLRSAEAELSPWPEPSEELREATIELIHIYESMSQADKVKYYRAKLVMLENSVD